MRSESEYWTSYEATGEERGGTVPALPSESAQWKSAAASHSQSWCRTVQIHFSDEERTWLIKSTEAKWALSSVEDEYPVSSMGFVWRGSYWRKGPIVQFTAHIVDLQPEPYVMVVWNFLSDILRPVKRSWPFLTLCLQKENHQVLFTEDNVI